MSRKRYTPSPGEQRAIEARVLLERVRTDGFVDGYYAAQWCESEDDIRTDPLSGEWAGDWTPAALLEAHEVAADSDLADSVLEAYETGYFEGAREALEARGSAREASDAHV